MYPVLTFQGCEVEFRVRSGATDYFRFDIEFKSNMRGLAVPTVRAGAMSRADIKRLAELLDNWLSDPDWEPTDAFVSYDAFFRLEFPGADVLRLSVGFGPHQALWLGLEGPVAESSVRDFREQWLRVVA